MIVKPLKFFTPDEFVRSSFFLPSDSAYLAAFKSDPLSFFDPEALAKLDATRKAAGIPFRLTCSLRSGAFDRSKGRSGKGDHCQGTGFDIACTESAARFRIVQAALKNGWTRIGVSKTFIHLGMSPSLPNRVIWLYD